MAVAQRTDLFHTTRPPARRAGATRAEALVDAVAERGDVASLRSLAVAGGAVVRREAVRALGRIGDDSCADALVDALADRRGDVARAASDALAAYFAVPRDRLWALFVKNARRDVRVRVVRLLARGGRPQSVISLLWACAQSRDANVRDAAVRGLRAWGPGWPGDVPLPQVFEVASALGAADAVLPPDVAGALWGFVTSRTGWRQPRATAAAAVAPRASVAPVPKGRFVATAAKRPAPHTDWAARVVLRRYELAPKPFARVRAWWKG